MTISASVSTLSWKPNTGDPSHVQRFIAVRGAEPSGSQLHSRDIPHEVMTVAKGLSNHAVPWFQLSKVTCSLWLILQYSVGFRCLLSIHFFHFSRSCLILTPASFCFSSIGIFGLFSESPWIAANIRFRINVLCNHVNHQNKG